MGILTESYLQPRIVRGTPVEVVDIEVHPKEPAVLLVLLVLPRSAVLETQRFRLPAPPPAGAGASQPARTMDGYADMAALNKSSSKIATFAVRIVGAKIGEYTFTSKRDTKPVVQHKFEAWLVGMNAQAYCL